AKAIFTPVVAYAPETSLSFGLGVKGLFKIKGSGAETRTSNIPLTLQYTINNNYLFFSGFQIFFPQERYILTGNLRVRSFPSFYFGVGKNTPNTNKEKYSYNQVLFEPIFLKNCFIPYLYMGTGFRYHKISNLKTVSEGLLERSKQVGALGSTSVGLELAILYDSRDNLLNAKEGLYARITHGFYGKILGGTQRYQLTRFDIRQYVQLFQNPNSVLAFQMLGHFSHGNAPLRELGRLGGDETLRGYFEGRYTDRHLLATQMEFRQKVTRRWGITAFVGAGSVAAVLHEFSLTTFRPAVGTGLRFLVDNVEELNLRIDFGVGTDLKYYFKIAEAF
ncbi:MAG: BamA/TamA family outer membrane protein, partial [Bacteroidota bacterium]